MRHADCQHLEEACVVRVVLDLRSRRVRPAGRGAQAQRDSPASALARPQQALPALTAGAAAGAAAEVQAGRPAVLEAAVAAGAAAEAAEELGPVRSCREARQTGAAQSSGGTARTWAAQRAVLRRLVRPPGPNRLAAPRRWKGGTRQRQAHPAARAGSAPFQPRLQQLQRRLEALQLPAHARQASAA